MALADACRTEGISIAVETNLSFPFETIAPLLEKMDLIMCDIKIFDDEKHRAYTGVSNKHVLENIRQIDKLGIPIIVRTPLIPDATDDIDNILSIARYIQDMKNLRRYELLNFNPLGAQKYKGLDKEDAFAQEKPFDAQRLAEIAHALETLQIDVKII